jgi:hypothetical protein
MPSGLAPPSPPAHVAFPPRLAGLQPGDVVAVRTPPSVYGWLIRLGALLRGRPSMVDHVAIVHHIDAAGRMWGIEGRPGGVGWVDLQVYDNRWLLSTKDQPKTDAQRQRICELAVDMLGTPYDWPAIIHDAAIAFGLDRLWRSRDFGPHAPGHVVCSSLASWLYHSVGLACPTAPVETCWPADWADFILRKDWTRGAG